jgi:hypothetical protein
VEAACPIKSVAPATDTSLQKPADRRCHLRYRGLHAERHCMVDGVVLDLHLNFGRTDVPVVDCAYGR